MSNLPVPQSNLGLKVATLEWAADAASDQLRRLDWVDGTIDIDAEPFQSKAGLEHRSYRHRPYAYFLPKAMAYAARDAQQRGEPTVVEAIQYMYARMEWMIAARRYLWSPLSPDPRLIAILAEAFGIGAEIHRNKREVLSRLVARLPTWYPHRGTVARARQLLEDTVGEKLDLQLGHIDSDGEAPDYPAIEKEVFACRNEEWWSQRSRKTSKTKMRIGNGMLLFQSKETCYPLLREDVLVGWKLGTEFPTNLLRLLPMWICIRIVILSGEKK